MAENDNLVHAAYEAGRINGVEHIFGHSIKKISISTTANTWQPASDLNLVNSQNDFVEIELDDGSKAASKLLVSALPEPLIDLRLVPMVQIHLCVNQLE